MSGNSKKPPESGFADLVGSVDSLKPGAEKIPPSGGNTERTGSSSRHVSAEIVVERRGDVLLGRAPGTARRVIDDLSRGPLQLFREIDLHRLSAAQAREVLVKSLRLGRRDGLRCLVVICGRGTHSGRLGAVLPDVVVETLCQDLASEILGFRSAPPNHGGSGAIIVRLKSLKR